MNFHSIRLLFVVCFAMLSGCSRDIQNGSPHGVQRQTAGTSTWKAVATPVALGGYPYGFSLGSSFYRVEQEAEQRRLKVEWVKWSDGPDGVKDGMFRVTNIGERAALVWNVRQQVCVPRSKEVGTVWETRRSDYPARGWQRPMIPPGASEEFLMPSEPAGVWRVCLLYSREVYVPKATNRQFEGTFESVGPSVREAD